MTSALIAQIEGYASVFNAPDLNGDIVAPGAFATSLKEKTPIRMLYQHAAETPIGRWLTIREDAYGLFVKGELILSSPRAREVHALLEGGAIDGLSIGYQTERSARLNNGRRILEAKLWEVSVVTFPMAAAARVTRVGPAVGNDDFGALAARFSQSTAPVARAQLRAIEESAAEAARARRRAIEESAAHAAVRAPVPFSPRGTGAHPIADAIRGAARKLSV